MNQILTARVSVRNNPSGISRPDNLWPNSGMDVFAIRRKNLRALIDTHFKGNQAALADAVGCKPPQINRWLSTTTSDRRNITERSARSIEEKLALKNLWLDTDHEDDDSAFLARLIALQKEYRALDGGTKSEIDAYLRAYPELQHLLGGKPDSK